MTRISLSLAIVAALAAAQPAFAASPVKPAPATQALPAADAAALDTALKGEWRDPKNAARDIYRHPKETLSFFGVKPTQTVVEITPGGGWYAEVLAPYLKAGGTYVAAVVDPASVAEKSRNYYQRSADGLQKKFTDGAAQYDKATTVKYDPAAPVFGAPASADVVLTFRNVHNWRKADQAGGMFKGFFAVLKPGGVLGVVEHRANKDVAADDDTGYVSEAQVIALAEAAGFRLDAKSEVNANPKDTKDYANGVWTLPPSNNHPEAERAKYQAIGESDRMTLRFVKPHH
ncbi:class I SAM-dependent methyltransferase [Pseudoxanthomonas sp. PXM01]|uniref:class I SAM-dependent methyltransferase n=1 Tax=Pseudoxanthomonas sp. PXM01 TaxID=2769295 RepID=UPI001784FB12|nr:class I SAM-dependent methyltransferase [Pseudoxanthomonas sp. PXM01]MBD9470728.1 class I SAM-dependent methyltransferase [Pseudoxanthomonas sp. PXM01]